MTEATVYVCRINTPDGAKDYVTLISPEVAFSRGLISEAIVGELSRPPEPGEVITAEGFTPNRVFAGFLHSVIARDGPGQPSSKAEAKRLGKGWIYVIDQRTPTPQGPVPPEDIIGVFEVRGGEVLSDSYRANPNHVLLSRNGFFRLEAGLHQCLMRELSSRLAGP